MKKALIACYLLGILISCEDQISPELREAPAVLVIDAFITNLDSLQIIRIANSRPYFDNTLLTGVTGASVRVINSNGITILFEDQGDGNYIWDPVNNSPLGSVGDSFTLQVTNGVDQYTATSSMNRVPDIDSITFRFEKENVVLPDSYFAEFWSRDPLGPGDTYWIKSYKNGIFLNQPNEMNIAFDAGFSAGGNVDGLIFIPPVRDTINPFVQDENDKFMSPFEDGDSVYVELYSITNQTFDFLNEIRIQTDRPGGFAELFSTPLGNVSTNIQPVGSSTAMAVGFFSVSAVKSAGKKLDITQVPRGN